jgi:hypothetical protein
MQYGYLEENVQSISLSLNCQVKEAAAPDLQDHAHQNGGDGVSG